MEIEAVVGAVVELGERLGVPMPSTSAVYACVKFLGEHRAAGVSGASRTDALSGFSRT
jgi:ketopantoate reductase